eukprot:811984-Amphidinium_carterae.1
MGLIGCLASSSPAPDIEHVLNHINNHTSVLGGMLLVILATSLQAQSLKLPVTSPKRDLAAAIPY